MKVVSWKSPSGETVDVCQDCELRLAGRWPRDQKGEEYCSVSRGLHHGECEVHKLGLDEMTTYSLTRGGSWMGAGSADGGDCWGWRASNGDGSGCYWLLAEYAAADAESRGYRPQVQEILDHAG